MRGTTSLRERFTHSELASLLFANFGRPLWECRGRPYLFQDPNRSVAAAEGPTGETRSS